MQRRQPIGPEASRRGIGVVYRRGVDKVKVTRRMAAGLGVVLILLGVAEVIRDVQGSQGGYVFWFVSLCGGGALILWGTFRPPARDPLALGMVVGGCLMAILATMWTIVLPILLLTLIALRVRGWQQARA